MKCFVGLDFTTNWSWMAIVLQGTCEWETFWDTLNSLQSWFTESSGSKLIHQIRRNIGYSSWKSDPKMLGSNPTFVEMSKLLFCPIRRIRQGILKNSNDCPCQFWSNRFLLNCMFPSVKYWSRQAWLFLIEHLGKGMSRSGRSLTPGFTPNPHKVLTELCLKISGPIRFLACLAGFSGP